MQLHNTTITVVDRNGHSQQKAVDLTKPDEVKALWADANSIAFQMHNKDDSISIPVPADVGSLHFVNNAGGQEAIGLLPLAVDDAEPGYVAVGHEIKGAAGKTVNITYPPGRTGVVTVTLARKTALAPATDAVAAKSGTSAQATAVKAPSVLPVDQMRIVTTFDVHTHNGVLRNPTSGAAVWADGTDKVATFKDRSQGDVIFLNNDLTRNDQQFSTLKQSAGNMAPIIYGFCDVKDVSRIGVNDPPRAAFIGQQGQIQCYEHPHGNFCNADDAKYIYIAWTGVVDDKHPAAATLVEGEK